jgi:hypothetical protein
MLQWQVLSRTKIGLVVTLIAVLAVCAPGSRADSTYTYTGNAFNQFGGTFACPTDCAVAGSFTVLNPLAPNSSGFFTPLGFSFEDGNFTFTPLNTTSSAFGVVTDSMGNIVQWNLNWFIGSLAMFSNTGVTAVCTDTIKCKVIDVIASPTSFAAVSDAPGIWSSSTQAPEPSTIFLLTLTLLMLCAGHKLLRKANA